jgi:hypothetical protein
MIHSKKMNEKIAAFTQKSISHKDYPDLKRQVMQFMQKKYPDLSAIDLLTFNCYFLGTLICATVDIVTEHNDDDKMEKNKDSTLVARQETSAYTLMDKFFASIKEMIRNHYEEQRLR